MGCFDRMSVAAYSNEEASALVDSMRGQWIHLIPLTKPLSSIPTSPTEQNRGHHAFVPVYPEEIESPVRTVNN
jgi:hypothetical protein